MEQLNHRVVGSIRSGHSPGMKNNKQMSLEEHCKCGIPPLPNGKPRAHLAANLQDRKRLPYPRSMAYHPVKCDADLSLGRKALNFSGMPPLTRMRS